jgi:hypothetical protein
LPGRDRNRDCEDQYKGDKQSIAHWCPKALPADVYRRRKRATPVESPDCEIIDTTFCVSGIPGASCVSLVTIELSREVTERDHHAFRVSFEQFTDRIGQPRGRVASAGRRMQGLLRENLEGMQTRQLREWFAAECDRINRGG